MADAFGKKSWQSPWIHSIISPHKNEMIEGEERDKKKKN
jgi:hypothetical protein